MDLYMRMIFVWVGSTNSIEPGFKPICGAVDWSLHFSAIRLISIYTTRLLPIFPSASRLD